MKLFFTPTNMFHGQRSTARGPRQGTAANLVCVRNTKCVSGTNRVSDTHNIHIYQSLTQLCVRCVRCVSFFKFDLQFGKYPLLFCKSCFDLIYLTHLTHISTAPVFPHFLTKSSWHTCWHAPDTQGPVPDTHQIPAHSVHQIGAFVSLISRSRSSIGDFKGFSSA